MCIFMKSMICSLIVLCIPQIIKHKLSSSELHLDVFYELESAKKLNSLCVMCIMWLHIAIVNTLIEILTDAILGNWSSGIFTCKLQLTPISISLLLLLTTFKGLVIYNEEIANSIVLEEITNDLLQPYQQLSTKWYCNKSHIIWSNGTFHD